MNWLTADEIIRLYSRPAGTVYRLASQHGWRRCDDKRPALYKASDVEETFARLNAAGRR